MPSRPSVKSKKPAKRKSKASRNGKSTRRNELVIITGMSGSGKGNVLKAFEDLGYYCVDNLPVELIPQFAELSKTSEFERTALVVDIREGDQLRKLPKILEAIKKAVNTK